MNRYILYFGKALPLLPFLPWQKCVNLPIAAAMEIAGKTAFIDTNILADTDNISVVHYQLTVRYVNSCEYYKYINMQIYVLQHIPYRTNIFFVNIFLKNYKYHMYVFGHCTPSKNNSYEIFFACVKGCALENHHVKRVSQL